MCGRPRRSPRIADLFDAIPGRARRRCKLEALARGRHRLKTTHKGSCHCGTVRYEVDVDLATGTGKCNCSFCAKVRNWSTAVKPAEFRLLAGRNALGDYQFSPDSSNHHYFCSRCGVRLYTQGYVEAIGGDYLAFCVATLDDLTDAERAQLPVRYMDGRNDDWFNEPAEMRHL
jgi:hypothetical protein